MTTSAVKVQQEDNQDKIIDDKEAKKLVQHRMDKAMHQYLIANFPEKGRAIVDLMEDDLLKFSYVQYPANGLDRRSGTIINQILPRIS